MWTVARWRGVGGRLLEVVPGRSGKVYGDWLTSTALDRLTAALAAGDPDGEVAAAWWAAQQLCLGYAMPDLAAARAHFSFMKHRSQ